MDVTGDDPDAHAGAAEQLDFHHPYTPYHVQEEFMKTAYQVLEKGMGQVGILESPTGTAILAFFERSIERMLIRHYLQGKSLSLICASLTWLRNHKSRNHEAALEDAVTAYKDEPPWLIEQLLRRKREDLAQRWEEREKRLDAVRQKERTLEERSRKRQRRDMLPAAAPGSTVDEDAEWLLDDREGRDDVSGDALSGLSKESRATLEKLGLGGHKQRQEEDDTIEEEIKLSQFIAELRRPSFPSSLPRSIAKEKGSKSEAVKLLPLSSRQKLCINPSVSRLGSVQAINDRCSELQQAKSGAKCPYVPNEELLGQTHQFRDAALATLPDIEDLYRLGKSLAVCPYYASRTALPAAEIITLPYPLLLQKKARDALGIKLEGNVVIIDEAHNIMDAVAGVHAAEVKLSELRRARGMLGVYVKRFGKKLKGENRVNVGRLGRVIEGLAEWMEGAKTLKDERGIVAPTQLTRPKGIDQINMYELIQFVQDSKMAYKIESYAAHVESETEPVAPPVTRPSTPVLHALVSFLVALTNTSSEGRFFYQRLAGPVADVQLSYMLLSPTHAFSSIVSSARAVILAGGTMSPFDDYRNHLFPSLAEDKLTRLSCDHVVPAANLCVRTLAGTGAGGATFEFSYQRRGDKALVAELGLAILNVCAVVPDGVVVFFPSYGYLGEVVAAWQQPREGRSIWERLQERKSVFLETKGGSSDAVLEQYAAAITGGAGEARARGAVLLSVVGGKMSEGINFSDRLGRCVVVVGMPYPNMASPEWKAKMEYVESTALAAAMPTTTTTTAAAAAGAAAQQAAKQAGRDYYENACMRAVNQSIGRAIRHRGDYAAIVLADRRYATERVRAKLPGWIRGAMAAGGSGGGAGGAGGLGSLVGDLAQFFRAKARSPAAC